MTSHFSFKNNIALRNHSMICRYLKLFARFSFFIPFKNKNKSNNTSDRKECLIPETILYSILRSNDIVTRSIVIKRHLRIYQVFINNTFHVAWGGKKIDIATRDIDKRRNLVKKKNIIGY